MKCMNCQSQNIDFNIFTCWCGKPYKKIIMDGGAVAFESQCNCHKKKDRIKFMVSSNTTPKEMRRIILRDDLNETQKQFSEIYKKALEEVK